VALGHELLLAGAVMYQEGVDFSTLAKRKRLAGPYRDLIMGRLAFSAAALDAPALNEGHPRRTSARSRSGGSAHTPVIYPSKANPAGLADVHDQRVRSLKRYERHRLGHRPKR